MTKEHEAALAITVSLMVPLVWFMVTPDFHTIQTTWSGESVAMFLFYVFVTMAADLVLFIQGAEYFAKWY